MSKFIGVKAHPIIWKNIYFNTVQYLTVFPLATHRTLTNPMTKIEKWQNGNINSIKCESNETEWNDQWIIFFSTVSVRACHTVYSNKRKENTEGKNCIKKQFIYCMLAEGSQIWCRIRGSLERMEDEKWISLFRFCFGVCFIFSAFDINFKWATNLLLYYDFM